LGTRQSTRRLSDPAALSFVDGPSDESRRSAATRLHCPPLTQVVAASPSKVRTEHDGAVLRIYLAGAPTGNALDAAMVAQLTEALTTLGHPDVTACTLLAEGAHFCVGGDHDEFARMAPAEKAALWAAITNLFAIVAGADVPVVVGVQGRAVGGGCELAVLGEFLIAAHDARLSLPQTRFGLTVGPGAVQAIAARCGTAQARRLVLLGETITGAEAAACGLADSSVAAEDLEAAALSLAVTLADLPPGAVRRTRMSLDAAAGNVRQLLQDEARRRAERLA